MINHGRAFDLDPDNPSASSLYGLIPPFPLGQDLNMTFTLLNRGIGSTSSLSLLIIKW